MATRIQENFPLQRLDIFSHPTQDDYERAKDKARQLLRSILPENSLSVLEDSEYLLKERERVRHRHSLPDRLRHRSFRQLIVRSSNGAVNGSSVTTSRNAGSFHCRRSLIHHPTFPPASIFRGG